MQKMQKLRRKKNAEKRRKFKNGKMKKIKRKNSNDVYRMLYKARK